jgi:flagellar assembly factor FliW
LLIETTRFGALEVGEPSLDEFPEGLIGLPGTHYALIVQGEDSPFLWLQSAEEPQIALPVTTPWLFFPGYEVRVPDEDAHRLGLERPEDATILVVVRAASELDDFTANLVGPIVMNRSTRNARQIINDAGGYSVRAPLFAEVELSAALPVAEHVPVQATAV